MHADDYNTMLDALKQIAINKFNLTPPPSNATALCVACGERMQTTDSRTTMTFGPPLIRRVKHCARCNTNLTTIEIPVAALAALAKTLEHQRALPAILRDLASQMDAFSLLTVR